MKFVKRLFVEEKGQDLAEYGMLLALIALIAVGAVGFLGTAISGTFQDMVDNVAW